FGDYSYLVRIDTDLKLRLGLKLGFSSYSNNLGNYDVVEDTDPRFMGEIGQNFMPNFGVGGFLYKDNYYFGLSVPKIIKNEFKNDFNNYSTEAELRHLFLMGGYIFDLSENIRFKPTALGKFISGAPTQLDLTTNFLISDRVWLGAMYRTGDSFGFLAQWIISNNLRFGYSVDFATSKLSGYQNGTHEVMVSYEISKATEKMTAIRLF
ncbi:MAG: type IX secretion system membrane protein PorP/SprF, partial [Prolixibacteraceae bacterium]